MGAPKKGSAKASEDADASLQAILLADSFATKFHPITLERPKVLLPLVNKPMIDYTLSWLESEGVREVFVFCCAHSHQIIEYLENSGWLSRPNFTVTTVESHNSTSAGDALRLIYERDVIHGDFVLISGDTVTNMSLTNAFQEHKERRKKDNDAVMTMVVKQSKPSPVTHQSRLGADEMFMAIDPQTNQLLYYEERAEHFKGIVSLDNSLLADNPSVSVHNDKQDCYIDICSQEVLSLFTDNFDYQDLRRHFVKGLLVDDIMGYKIFTHEIQSSYAARIDSYRSYDTVSKDIIQRWTYPYVPDVNFSGNYSAKLGKEGMYRAPEIEQSRSAQIGPFTFIGKGTSIGDNSKISNSCIGEGCKIGSGVSIVGSYIWDNVTIEDGCELKHAIVCNGVVIKSKAVLEPGVVLSFKVVVGEKFVVPAYSKVSLLKEPTMQDSDEELEYADNSSGSGDASELGEDGIGYIWSIGEGNHDEEWRHSVAPIPADKLAELGEAIEDSLELLHLDSGSLPPPGELEPDEDINDSDDFEKEVEATFLKAVDENDDVKNVILEMSALRLSCEGKSAADCGRAIFYSMMKLAVETPRSNKDQFPSILSSVIDKWRKLLQHFDFAKDIVKQIELILKLEEMCRESLKELSPLFEKILYVLYDKDIVSEDAILKWDEDKEDAEESDRVFVKQSQGLIKWLKVAEEEEEEEED